MSNVVNDIFNNPTIRKVLFRGRFVFAAALLVPVAYYMQQRWLLLGLGVSMFGQLIQTWCFASLVKNSELTVRGPYLMCRNPMYVGRYFMILGFGILLWNPWIIGAYTLFYWLYMSARVSREERRLEGFLGEPYLEYRRTVNRYFPSLRPLTDRRLYFFDRGMFLHNNAHWNILATLSAYGLLYVIRWAFEAL
jgi:protein-S-isoprenylcysteine O-methyltransferase Ste14